MKSSLLLCVALAVSLGFVLVAGGRYRLCSRQVSIQQSKLTLIHMVDRVRGIQSMLKENHPNSTGFPRDPEDKEYVLVNNKCQCVTVTSKFIPSKENPGEEILERNIRILVPLQARENISDPLSPLRTTFVYRMTELCKKCDPVEIELGGEVYQAQQSTSCDNPETCYTYNRDKCYTTTFPFLYHGEMKSVPAVLTPTSCYAE